MLLCPSQAWTTWNELLCDRPRASKPLPPSRITTAWGAVGNTILEIIPLSLRRARSATGTLRRMRLDRQCTPKLADPNSCCERPTRDIHCKNVRWSNGIWARCSDATVAQMSSHTSPASPRGFFFFAWPSNRVRCFVYLTNPGGVVPSKLKTPLQAGLFLYRLLTIRRQRWRVGRNIPVRSLASAQPRPSDLRPGISHRTPTSLPPAGVRRGLTS